MKKIKRISREQYLALAALKMPVYSHTMPLPDRYIFRCLRDEITQLLERDKSLEYSRKYTKFVTLVDSE